MLEVPVDMCVHSFLDLSYRVAREMEQSVQKIAAKSDGITKDDENGYTYKASWFTQFRSIMWRAWISTLKEPLLVKVRLIQTTVS